MDKNYVEQLEKDTAFLESEMPKLMAEAGKYALVYQEKLLGIFATYDEALTSGYAAAGLKPFLVELISQVPNVQQFTRVIGFECLTSS